jgi:hypothetical protein
VPLRQPFCDGFFKIDLGNYLTKADFEPWSSSSLPLK